MLLSTNPETLYVPRNLNEIGNKMKYDINTPIMKSRYIVTATRTEYFFSFSYSAGVMKRNSSIKMYGDAPNIPMYRAVVMCVINWLERRVALGEKELVRLSSDEALLANAEACLKKAKKDLLDFTQTYSQNLLKEFAYFAEKGNLELLATCGTYAFLPHYGDMTEILNAQVEIGLYSHRQYFGSNPDGFYLPFMGYTASKGSLTFITTVIFATIGGVLGSLVCFLIGRFGRGFFRKLGR